MRLATLPFQLSSADASDQSLLDVMPCIHAYSQQITAQQYRKHSQPLLNMLVLLSPILCGRQKNSSHKLHWYWDCIKRNHTSVKVKFLDSNCVNTGR